MCLAKELQRGKATDSLNAYASTGREDLGSSRTMDADDRMSNRGTLSVIARNILQIRLPAADRK
jgi:hypothetical protein